MRIKQCCPPCGSVDIMVVKILRGPERYGSLLTEWLPHRWFCECRDCGRRSAKRWTRRMAIKAWNGRDEDE